MRRADRPTSEMTANIAVKWARFIIEFTFKLVRRLFIKSPLIWRLTARLIGRAIVEAGRAAGEQVRRRQRASK